MAVVSPEVRLRQFTLSDVDAFMVWATDERVSRFKLWEPYASKDAVLDLLTNFIIPHPWYRAICVSGCDDRPVGAICVRPYPEDHRSRMASIAYCVAYDQWGKGFCTAAVKLVLATIFREWPHLERLKAIVDAENVASCRVLEKAGFTREGVLRNYAYVVAREKIYNVVMYSFLSTDALID